MLEDEATALEEVASLWMTASVEEDGNGDEEEEEEEEDSSIFRNRKFEFEREI